MDERNGFGIPIVFSNTSRGVLSAVERHNGFFINDKKLRMTEEDVYMSDPIRYDGFPHSAREAWENGYYDHLREE